LTTVSKKYENASRPWILYWILHSLELLDEEVDTADQHNIVQFLASCQDPNGGYGGGPGEMPHLVHTYAAVNALMIIGTEEAFALTNRPKLYSWLDKLRQHDGSFLVHVDGDVDVRGIYCALSVARITNIYKRRRISGSGTARPMRVDLEHTRGWRLMAPSLSVVWPH